MGNRRYNIEMECEEHNSLNFLYISTSKYEGDWQSIRHTHPFSELFYVLHGTGSFEVNETQFNLEPDDLIIVNPHVPHTERSLNQEPLEYIVLGIKGLSFAEDYAHFNYHNNHEEILFFLQQILKETKQKKENYEVICKKLLEILLIHLVRNQQLTISNTPDSNLSRECLQIQRYLDSHYADSVTLDTLAELSHLNKYYLAHAFTRYTGLSPINYLIKKRINEAKNLLSNTDYSVSDIALSVGFSSQSYFAQAFKKECKVTPVAYRKGNV